MRSLSAVVPAFLVSNARKAVSAEVLPKVPTAVDFILDPAILFAGAKSKAAKLVAVESELATRIILLLAHETWSIEVD